MASDRAKVEERIKRLRADIDALIDEHVKQLAVECPSILPSVLRHTAVGYNADCQCNAFLDLAEKGAL